MGSIYLFIYLFISLFLYLFIIYLYIYLFICVKRSVSNIKTEIITVKKAQVVKCEKKNLGSIVTPLGNLSVKGAVESKSAYDKRAFYITYSIFFIHLNFISQLWPNGQITGNITMYITHKTTSKWIHLNTSKLHNQIYIENKKKILHVNSYCKYYVILCAWHCMYVLPV